MKQLSVVLTRYPFSNQIDYKIRPAVIISNEKFNKIHNCFWVCPITRKVKLKEFEIEIPEKEFSGKLNYKSYVRSDKIATMEKELFLKEIGTISQKLFGKLKKEIIKNMEEN